MLTPARTTRMLTPALGKKAISVRRLNCSAVGMTIRNNVAAMTKPSNIDTVPARATAR